MYTLFYCTSCLYFTTHFYNINRTKVLSWHTQTSTHCKLNSNMRLHIWYILFHLTVGHTDRGGFRGGGGPDPPLSYMKNDVMHTVIYAAFCMLPSLDLQDITSFKPSGVYIDLIKSSYMCINETFNRAMDRMVRVSRN